MAHMMARDTTIGDVEYIIIKETYKRSGKTSPTTDPYSHMINQIINNNKVIPL